VVAVLLIAIACKASSKRIRSLRLVLIVRTIFPQDHFLLIHTPDGVLKAIRDSLIKLKVAPVHVVPASPLTSRLVITAMMNPLLLVD
jgi:hypothetical protein